MLESLWESQLGRWMEISETLEPYFGWIRDVHGSESKAHHLPSWAPRYYLLHTMPVRDRIIVSEATANSGVFRGTPRVVVEGTEMLVEGVRIGAVYLVGKQPSLSLQGPRATNSYLLDFERRHKGRYVTGVSCATAYFGTLMMDEVKDCEDWRSRIIKRLLSEHLGSEFGHFTCLRTIYKIWYALRNVFVFQITSRLRRQRRYK